MRADRDDIIAGALVLLGVVGTIILIGWAIVDWQAQHRCTRLGGDVERYNFRTVLMPTSCGDNCTMWVPMEVSDWRCVGAPAEAR